MKLPLLLACRTLLMIGLSGSAYAGEPSAMELRFDEFYTLVDAADALPERRRAEKIDASYRRLFGRETTPDRIASLDGRDIEALFRAASLTAARDPSGSRIPTLISVNASLEARGLLTRRHVAALYEALLAANRFDDAARLRERYRQFALVPFPQVVEPRPVAAGSPSLLVLNDDGSQLSREPYLHQRGPSIIVISSPYCHFSRDAVRDLEGDSALASLFRKHSTWIAPRDATVNGPALAAWNRAHPLGRVSIAYDQRAWPLEEWNTPTFYFLLDGRPVRVVSGWPAGGRRAELVAALRTIGLAPAPVASAATSGTRTGDRMTR